MKSGRGSSRFRIVMLLLVSLALLVFGPGSSLAKTAQEIDEHVDAAIQQFERDIKGGRELVHRAAGVLVFEGVIKAGLGVGGEHGEGALRISGKTVGYYSISGASIGLQIGGQKRDILIAFMDPAELQKFRAGSAFKVGGDMSVAVAKMGAGGGIDSQTMKQPVVGFIYGEKGLMGNLTLEGSKITKEKK